MKYSIGVIGAGNMATALLCGAHNAGLLDTHDVYIYDINQEVASVLCEKIAGMPVFSLRELLQTCNLIFLVVKPNVVDSVLSEIRHNMDTKKTSVISIVTGATVGHIKHMLGEECRVLRIMPNTPLLCGCGASVFAEPSDLSKEAYDMVYTIFSSQGIVLSLPEAKLDAVTGLSGSGPAYGYMLIEAMADAGVKNGLTRKDALLLAAKTIEGAAKMVLTTEQHPAALKDNVCSPGGTTIEGVAVLESKGFRGAVIDAVDAAVKKAGEL